MWSRVLSFIYMNRKRLLEYKIADIFYTWTQQRDNCVAWTGILYYVWFLILWFSFFPFTMENLHGQQLHVERKRQRVDKRQRVKKIHSIRSPPNYHFEETSEAQLVIGKALCCKCLKLCSMLTWTISASIFFVLPAWSSPLICDVMLHIMFSSVSGSISNLGYGDSLSN